jgi:hypothetical protein
MSDPLNDLIDHVNEQSKVNAAEEKVEKVDFLKETLDRANEQIKINAAEEKIEKLKAELFKLIQARRIAYADIAYVEITTVYRAHDTITFVTSETTYLCIGIDDELCDDGGRPEFDFPFLSIDKALEYKILTACQVEPLLKAEREESARRSKVYAEARDQKDQAKKAGWLKEFLETPEGIGAAISICGVEATKKYLEGVSCPSCGRTDRCRCYVPPKVKV